MISVCKIFCIFAHIFLLKKVMKHLKWMAVFAIFALTSLCLSCSRNVFDEGEYREIIKNLSPVDTVEANHNWILTSSKVLLVTPPVDEPVERISILTANPKEDGKAKVVGEAYVITGNRATLSITYPITMNTLYAAAVTSDGYYTITSFKPASTSIIDFSNPIVVHERIAYDPQPQMFVFCYEDEYPEPGDYDYNDVVLKISHLRTGEKELRFTVQLAAVGATKQVAACLRLVGVNYNKIESVKTVGDQSFNVTNGQEFPEQMRTVQKDASMLLQAQNGDAVINLFMDAHWATGDALNTEYGIMQRKHYNVAKGTSADYQMMVPREITYIVTFTDALNLDGLSLGEIDPFIIAEYNSSKYETHLYAFRHAQVLNPYPYPDIQNLPYALAIPYEDFRWILDGCTIGFMIEGSTFGAYDRSGHSFGEWSMDHTKALDWYLYPKENQVY